MTKRNIAEELEKILEESIPLLDHGFIRVIDYMGNDNSIVQAARVSYGKGTKSINDDRALIRYLMKHKHTTPFEMCEIKLHIKVPLFVARQWLRHRTANVNEYSARYSILESDFYIPKEDQISYQSASNKQGRGNTVKDSFLIQEKMKTFSENAYKLYEDFIQIEDGEQKKGLAKEIARIILPVNAYTQFYWKIDLHNLLHFLRLRTHSHAQYEIREYANVILDIVKKWVPITYEAFLDYHINSHNFSREEINMIKDLIQSKDIKNNSLSKREFNEFCKVLNLNLED